MVLASGLLVPLGAQAQSVNIMAAPYNAACNGTTDDSAALAHAATDLRDTGRLIYIPGNCRLRLGGAAQVWLRGVGLTGDGIHAFNIGSASGPAAAGTQGSTILVQPMDPTTDASAPSPIVVSNDWSISGLTFIWPRQTEAAAAANGGQPIAYKPLVSVHVTTDAQGTRGDTSYGWAFTNNVVRNAFDILDFTAASGGGHARVAGNSMFALRFNMRFRQQDGEVFISDNQFTAASNVGAFPVDPSTHQLVGNLLSYAASNTEMLRVEGTGTAGTPSAVSVDGQHLSNNVMYLGRHGLHVVGGFYNLGTWSGMTFDQVASAVTVEQGGKVAETTITGGTWLCQHYNNYNAVAACVGFDGGAPGSSISISNVSIPVSYGPAVYFADSGAGVLGINGSRMVGVGNTTVGGPYHGVVFASPNGSLTISGTVIGSSPAARSTAQAHAQGVVVNNALTSVLSGLTLANWDVPIVYNTSIGKHVVVGSTSSGAGQNPAFPNSYDPNPGVAGPGARFVTQAGNNWDQGTQTQVIGTMTVIVDRTDDALRAVGKNGTVTTLAPP